MLHHDENVQTIDLKMCNWPVVITGDGFQSTVLQGMTLPQKLH